MFLTLEEKTTNGNQLIYFPQHNDCNLNSDRLRRVIVSVIFAKLIPFLLEFRVVVLIRRKRYNSGDSIQPTHVIVVFIVIFTENQFPKAKKLHVMILVTRV